QEVDTADFDSIPASMIRVAQRDYDYASKLPNDFVAEYAQTTADAFEVWRKAKAANDYALFIPALRHIFELKMREAEIRGYSDHPYDIFLAHWERGFTTNQVKAIFDAQKPALIELVAAVNAVQE